MAITSSGGKEDEFSSSREVLPAEKNLQLPISAAARNQFIHLASEGQADRSRDPGPDTVAHM